MTNQINQNNVDMREFGKDITNGFVGNRSSLDSSLQMGFAYKNQKQPVGKTIKPLQSNGFQGLNIANLKKSQFGLMKKNSFQTYTQNESNGGNMEVDVNPFTFNKNKECYSYRDNRGNINDNPNETPDGYLMNMKYNQNTHKLSEPLPSTNYQSQLNEENSQVFQKLSISSLGVPFKTIHQEETIEKSDHLEYIDSIFMYLKHFENENQCLYTRRGYMKESQYDINEKMRAILLDWLIEVHLKFKLQQETFFLTINLIDRYLDKKTIQRTKLQLVGITSMFIACKYEEIYAPEVKDFVFITDKAYTNEEVLSMERDILGTVNFDVTVPSSLRFIELYNYYISFDETVYCFMHYLLDLSVVDYRMLKYKSSLIAASVVYVSIKLLHKENIIRNEKIEEDIKLLYLLSEYTEEEIKICAKDVCMIYDYSEKTGLIAIKKKYSLSKYKEVSRIKFGVK